MVRLVVGGPGVQAVIGVEAVQDRVGMQRLVVACVHRDVRASGCGEQVARHLGPAYGAGACADGGDRDQVELRRGEDQRQRVGVVEVSADVGVEDDLHFRAPSRIPSVTFRSKIRYKTITGATISIRLANWPARSVTSCPANSVSPIGSVRLVGCNSRMFARPSSFQSWIPWTRATATSAPRDIGSTTEVSARTSPAPSRVAASTRSRGKLLKKARMSTAAVGATRAP